MTDSSLLHTASTVMHPDQLQAQNSAVVTYARAGSPKTVTQWDSGLVHCSSIPTMYIEMVFEVS